MKRLFIILITATSLSASAQMISPTNEGDLLRARSMLADKNYNGVSDQLSRLNRAALTPEEVEEAWWLQCQANAHINPEAAIGQIEEFLGRYPASAYRVEAILLAGDCAVESDAAKALEFYNRIEPTTLSAETRGALAYHKGYAQLRLGNEESAEKQFEQALKVKEWASAAKFQLGYIAYSRKEYGEAKQYFNSSSNELKYFYLAQINYAEGEYSEALADARKAMNMLGLTKEQSCEALRIEGESLFAMGQTQEGIAALKKYVSQTDAPALSSLYILGTENFKKGRPEEAIEMLQKVVAEGAEYAMTQSAYLFLGQSYLSRNNPEAALIAFSNALKMDYDAEVQETAYYNYAVTKFGGAKMPFESSAATFEEYISKFPNGAHAREVEEYLVEGYIADGQYDTALAAINRVKNPSQKVISAKQKTLYALGSRALAAGEAEKAEKYLEVAEAQNGPDKQIGAQSSLLLGEAMARQGKNREAVDYIKRYQSVASKEDPNRAISYYDLGYAYFSLGQYDKSATNFDQFVKMSSKMPVEIRVDALNRLGDSDLYKSNFTAASAAYSQAYEIMPSAGDYPLFQMALIEGYGRKHKQKIETLSRLLNEFPTSSLVPDALLEMTESYIQLGDNPSAITAYRRLISEYPATEQGRKGYLQMALTLLNSGRRTEAVTAYKDVVALYPSSEEAVMALDELKRISADDGTLGELSTWLQGIDGAPKLDVAEADRLSFEAAEKQWITEKSISKIKTYLSDFADGTYRPRALAYLVEYHQEGGHSKEVITYASEIIERYPDSSQAESALIAKGSAEYSLGQASEALSTWSALEQKASNSQTLSMARIGILRAAADIENDARVIAAADAILSTTTAEGGVRREAQFARALALSRTGRLNEARTAWEDLAQSPVDIFGAKSRYYLAESYFNAGNLAQAETNAHALIDSGTPHNYWIARAFILLSDIYNKEGKEFEAREYLKSLRDNYPGSEPDIFEMINQRLK